MANPANGLSESDFRIRIHPAGNEPYAFTVAEKNGEQFAAELDVLSALIRARIIAAKFAAG
jgi:hypothetical protein